MLNNLNYSSTTHDINHLLAKMEGDQLNLTSTQGRP